MKIFSKINIIMDVNIIMDAKINIIIVPSVGDISCKT